MLDADFDRAFSLRRQHRRNFVRSFAKIHSIFGRQAGSFRIPFPLNSFVDFLARQPIDETTETRLDERVDLLWIFVYYQKYIRTILWHLLHYC